MSRKTRKLIWSAPLVAVLAVAVGALAVLWRLRPVRRWLSTKQLAPARSRG